MTGAWTWPATAALVSLGIIASVASTPKNATTLTVVFPPWWTQARAWRAASRVGYVVDAAAAPFVLVVHSDGGDVERRARRAGAVLVLDAKGLGACAERQERSVG